MTAKSISETKRVRYLLGLSSPAEREDIEFEYFQDEDAFQEMLTAEDDLVDAYVRGELVGGEHSGFEKSFVNTLRGRDRVQFARAFAGAICAIQPVESKLNAFKKVQSFGLLRTATITAVVVFLAMVAWLVIDRLKMINELRELRAESAELSKRSEALQRSSDIERTRTTEIAAQLAAMRAKPDKARQSRVVTNDRENIASSEPVPVGEKPANTEESTIGNTFASRQMTQLPVNADNVVGLLSLQPGKTRDDFVAGERARQASVTLEGVDLFNIYSLMPRHTSSGETTFRIPSSLTWITFQLKLETAAIHDDYRIIITTADGRTVTTDNWSEPLTRNQTIIDTPAISVSYLSSGDYILLLMGKEPDGSFVKVAEYSFKVIKY